MYYTIDTTECWLTVLVILILAYLFPSARGIQDNPAPQQISWYRCYCSPLREGKGWHCWECGSCGGISRSCQSVPPTGLSTWRICQQILARQNHFNELKKIRSNSSITCPCVSLTIFPTWGQGACLELSDNMTQLSLKIGPIGVLQGHQHVLYLDHSITFCIKLTKGLTQQQTGNRKQFAMLLVTQSLSMMHQVLGVLSDL